MYADTIPCAFKKRVEQRASEEFRSVSEKCIVSGWGNVKSLGSFCTVLQDNREDLGTLMHQMLVKNNDKTRCSSSKTPLFPWQVCLSAKQHLGGYLDTEEELAATKRNVSFLKRAPPRCHRSNLTSEILADESSCVEREPVEEARAKSASNVGKNNGHVQDACGGKLCRNAQSPAHSASPTNFKFYHSKYTDYHIKNYREQITDESIRKHIYAWLKENNKLKPKPLSEKKSTKKTQEVKSITIPKPSFTLYRFRFSKDKSSNESGCLKVGPCPSVPEQKESKKADANKINKSTASEKAKPQTNMAPAAAADRRLDQKRNEVKTISSLKCQNTFPPRENTLSCSESKDSATSAPKVETSEGKLKKVQLRVHRSSDSPRIVPKTGGRVYVNKTKTRLLGVCKKPLIQYCKSGSEIPKVARKPTFGTCNKEFLRITTPKPLTTCQSQTSSDFDESPGFSPAKSVEISPARSPVPSLSGTRLRSQVIAEILMKREPQAVFPKNSNFQACITPANYSTRRAETQRRKRNDLAAMDLEQKFAEDQNLNENRAQRVSSQPSIPRIGPFISG